MMYYKITISMKNIFKTASIVSVSVGVLFVVLGVWGSFFTRTNVARERITTPEDASIPNALVRGPLTLKSQSDIIRFHTLKATGGKTYSEMPRQITKLDSEGRSVLDMQGKPIMIANSARDIWITATALTTALNLGIFAYIFSFFVIFIGCILGGAGVLFYLLSKKSQ